MLPHQHRQPPKPNQASVASKPTGMDTKCYLGSLAFHLFTVLSMSYQVHCKKSDFLFVKSTGEKLRVKSVVYFLV